jgi:cytochrome c oxidase accessory protein FixG
MPTMKLERPSREAVTTIRADGSRPFLFPATVRGRFATARALSASALIVVYFILPWLKVNGYPAVFLDVAERRFHLFGLTLAAQDLWLLFFLITGVGFSLFFVTALFGRIWCGWACPQTVFLDHVYRRIERWIDGDAIERRKLHLAPLSATKIRKRAIKHLLYFAAAAAITHLFLAYFVSVPEVWSMMRAAPGENWGAFAFMAISTGLLYFNFAWFREQLCIVICPYGRLQSALIDGDTMVIGYDAGRGEPRGHAGASAGACVDCTRCVQVCPTGIDIRHGLQMECIGCTACVDACDDVMTRLGRPRGLIRYDSPAAFAGRRTRWIRPRTVLYFALLLIGAAVATWALSTVRAANVSVTRMTGAPYIVDAASVRNQFLVRIVNKRNVPVRFVVSVNDVGVGLRQIGFDQPVEIPPLGELVQPLIVVQARDRYTGEFRVAVRVVDAEAHLDLRREVEFVGPDIALLRQEQEERHHAESHTP